MIESDKPRFAGIITALAETFERELSEVVIGVYFDALRDLSIESVQKAASACVRTSRFMPRPAEIREQAGGGPTAAKDNALVAYTQAVRMISSVGSYRTPPIEDPISVATIQAMGGWVAFCTRDDADKWVEKEFREWYEHFARVGAPEDQKRLVGHHEAIAERRERFKLVPPSKDETA